MVFCRRQKPRRTRYAGTTPGKATYCTYIFHTFSKISMRRFLCMNYWACLAEQHPCLHPGQLHKDILPPAPAEASHRKRLLQESIPCSEQLWTILVTASKCLRRSSGNVLLYNRLGPDMQQKASVDIRARFKSQAEPPDNTFHGFRVPHLRIIVFYPYS